MKPRQINIQVIPADNGYNVTGSVHGQGVTPKTCNKIAHDEVEVRTHVKDFLDEAFAPEPTKPT